MGCPFRELLRELLETAGTHNEGSSRVRRGFVLNVQQSCPIRQCFDRQRVSQIVPSKGQDRLARLKEGEVLLVAVTLISQVITDWDRQ